MLREVYYKNVNMPRFHKVEINKTEWIVPERYQVLTPVGSGAYGQVWYVFVYLNRSNRRFARCSFHFNEYNK